MTTKFMHFRNFVQGSGTVAALPHGGATVAYVEGDTGISYGVAYCHDNDRYDRKKGRLIAEGRMFNERTSKAAPLPVESFRKEMEIIMAGSGFYRRT